MYKWLCWFALSSQYMKPTFAQVPVGKIDAGIYWKLRFSQKRCHAFSTTCDFIHLGAVNRCSWVEDNRVRIDLSTRLSVLDNNRECSILTHAANWKKVNSFWRKIVVQWPLHLNSIKVPFQENQDQILRLSEKIWRAKAKQFKE